MSIAANLTSINQRIHYAAQASGRDDDSVRLIAVSKFHPVDSIQQVIDAGHRLFGENRVQEAKRKFSALRAAYPDLELHLIGPLQTNKAEDAIEIFDVIETLDRPALALALSKAMKKMGRQLPCLIEVNIGDERQKAGIAPADLSDFINLCRAEHGLEIVGLMCIPLQGQDPKPYFARLRQLAEAHHLAQISMGMSGDFEVAIAEGATLVRIGTALFGEREQP